MNLPAFLGLFFLICFLHGSQLFLGIHEIRQPSALFDPFMEFSGGCKNDIAGAVQAGFHGILYNADNETNANHLHGNVIGDAE